MINKNENFLTIIESLNEDIDYLSIILSNKQIYNKFFKKNYESFYEFDTDFYNFIEKIKGVKK